MRGADFAASTPFAALVAERVAGDDVVRADLDRQRRHLIESATGPGDRVAVPAHASRGLVDAVKACGRSVVFAPIGPTGATDIGHLDDAAAVWHQTVAGVHAGTSDVDRAGPVELIDAHDTVVLGPAPGIAGVVLSDSGPRSMPPAWLVEAQRNRVAAVAAGLRHAAALPVLAPAGHDVDAGPIPTGVVVRLPDTADPLTFVAYAQAELTGVEWFAMRRPLHPQARHHLDPEQLATSLAHLSRFVIVPVSPFSTDEEVGHAVLGIVKTAEYTGWRWHDDPEHAAKYACWISDRYGPDHEAYRPAFDVTPGASSSQATVRRHSVGLGDDRRRTPLRRG